MSPAVRFALVVLAACLCASCAAFTSKSDYADYRAVRMAPDEDARLLAMEHYVDRHPDGRWFDQIQRQRGAHDAPVFESAKSSRSGLELYLAAFPDGQFVEQARARLKAIDVIEARKRAEADQAQKLAEERKKREAELSRTWVSRFFGYWTRTLVTLDHWGEPIEQVARGNREFSRAFGRPPRPRCTAEECVKYYASNYAVPIPGGTRIERSMQLLLRLRMTDGKLRRAELLLPAWGFSRWKEVEERRAVVDADPEDRRKAVEWALARVVPMLPEDGRVAIADYQLEPIAPPGIGPSGELTDTTAEDPSAPQNRIQGSAVADEAAGQGAEPSVEELVKPEAPEEAADMVLGPMTVDKQGRLAGTGEDSMEMQPLVVPQGSSGEVMVMDPLAVPSEGNSAGGGTQGQPPAGESGTAAVQVQVAPPVVQAYRVGQMKIVAFAAGSDAGAPAYDGLLIEWVGPTAASGAAAKKKPKQPAKP